MSPNAKVNKVPINVTVTKETFEEKPIELRENITCRERDVQM